MHSSQDEIATDSPSLPASEESVPAALTRSGSRLAHPVRILVVAAIVVVGSLVLLGLLKKTFSTRNRAGTSAVHTDALQGLRFKGTTEAVLTRAILAPVLAGQQVGTLTITRLVASGSHVKRGDVLVEFDRQAQMRDFIDKQAD